MGSSGGMGAGRLGGMAPVERLARANGPPASEARRRSLFHLVRRPVILPGHLLQVRTRTRLNPATTCRQRCVRIAASTF